MDYTPFIKLLVIIAGFAVLGKLLISPKGAGTLLAYVLIGGFCAGIIVLGVTLFLSGDSVRALLN